MRVRFLFLVALMFCCCKAKPAPLKEPHVRNVLLITIDTLRADALSVYGSKTQTPFFEKFADRAVVFENAYTCAPLTLPSHVSLMTGLYPPSHGVRNNGTFRAPASLQMLAESAKRNGVATAAIIGGYPLASQFGMDQGFDYYDDSFPETETAPGVFLYAEKNAQAVRAAGIDWLKHLPPDRSYFLWLHFFDPHHPYQSHGMSAMTPYQQEVLYVDQQLSELFSFLQQTKRDDNTLVIATSDHGEAFGEHGEISHSLFVYNTTLRIPLMYAMPGAQPERRKELVRIIDIAPTVLEATGWGDSEGMQGLSLFNSAPRESYAETLAPALDFGWSPLFSMQDQHSKFILAPRPEFYDLDFDPAEMKNVSSSGKTDSYRRKIEVVLRKASEQTGRTVTPEERETLQSLGYFAAGPVKVTGSSVDPKDRVEVARKIAELTATPIPLKAKAQAYEEIVRDEPENPMLLLRYAEILLKLQNFTEAQSIFQKVLRLGHASAYAYNGLATAYFSQQKTAEAEKVLHQAVDKKHADGETYYNLGEFLFNRGARDEAFRYYDESIKLDFRPAFFRKARLKDVLGATEDSYRILEMAEKSDPSDFRVNYERALIYYRHDQGPEALAQLQNALKKGPDQKWLYYEIGLVYLRMNQLANAQNAMRQFLTAAPPTMKKERDYAESVLKQKPS